MKTAISISIVVSLMLLVSAAVWEGVTDVVSTGDLPGNYSVATNSFPKNSIVDITNLENGKMVRAIVVSGLETTGLLATLSRNAANSLDLRGNSTCRIRITQPSDDIAFSRFKLGPIAAPPAAASEPDTLSENNASEGTDRADRDEAQNLTAAESDSGADNTAVIGAGIVGANDANTGTGYTLAAEASAGAVIVAAAEEPAGPVLKSTEIIMGKAPPETVTEITTVTTRTRAAQDMATAVTKTTPQEAKASVMAEPEIIPQDTAVQAFAQPVTQQPAYAVTEPVAAPASISVTSASSGNLDIIPSEERPPNAANRFAIAPEDRAPPLKKNNVSNLSSSSPVKSDFSPFQVPLISRLEQGKCYVQVAAYQRVEHVEDEINRIGMSYPLAVQNVGSDTNPMFRILLGPLNQGESGALLQRVKSIGYNDAFIRYN